jgi:hypothetical protein
MTTQNMKTHTHTTQPAKTTLAEAQANTLKGMGLLALGFTLILLLACALNSLTTRKR